jgi:hypothetical protein
MASSASALAFCPGVFMAYDSPAGTGFQVQVVVAGTGAYNYLEVRGGIYHLCCDLV